MILELKIIQTEIIKPFTELELIQIGNSYSAKGRELFFCHANMFFHGSIGYHIPNLNTCTNNKNIPNEFVLFYNVIRITDIHIESRNLLSFKVFICLFLIAHLLINYNIIL